MISKSISLFLAAIIASSALVQAGGYAVVVSKATATDSDWKPVIEALQKKHGGEVIVWESKLEEALPALQKLFPKYTCIVAKPEECGRMFVARAHVMARKLDSDPYPDTIWGIVTGYDASDALRIAKHATPLVVKRALTGTVGSPLDAYEEGVMFDELKPKSMWSKEAGKKVAAKECPQDTTKLIVNSLNEDKPDVFITSGHATENDWQLGFTYRNGYFRCKDGQLYGQDVGGKRHNVNSPNPKVHLPVGNCLIAHIPKRDCMALALMRSAGVHQMVGYTIPTGYGYGGWGVKDYFSELQAGRFSLAEAHYANQLALIYNMVNLPRRDRSVRRLLGDRDVVVLYGDPAWEARMEKRELLWTQSLSEKDGVYTFTVAANERGDWDNRPVVHLLPQRLKNVKLLEGDEHKPVIGDNFILIKFNKGVLPMKGNRGGEIPIRGDFEKGDTFSIRFSAEKID